MTRPYRSDPGRESLAQFSYIGTDALDAILVSGFSEDLEDPVSDLVELVASHAATGDGRGTDPHPARASRWRGIVGNHVHVHHDSCLAEYCLGDISGQIHRSQVGEYHVIVGSSGDQT